MGSWILFNFLIFKFFYFILGGKLEPQDRSFLLMGGEQNGDEEKKKDDEKTEKSDKVLIEELD